MKKIDQFHSRCEYCGFTTADPTTAANHKCVEEKKIISVDFGKPPVQEPPPAEKKTE